MLIIHSSYSDNAVATTHHDHHGHHHHKRRRVVEIGIGIDDRNSLHNAGEEANDQMEHVNMDDEVENTCSMETNDHEPNIDVDRPSSSSSPSLSAIQESVDNLAAGVSVVAVPSR